MKLDLNFSELSQRFDAHFQEQNKHFNVEVGELAVIHGRDGATFYPSLSDKGILSWTNDRELDNPLPVNIRGKDGHTPIKGTDYYTEADKAEMVSAVIAEIEIPEDEGGKVEDVQANGASILDENGVANIPYTANGVYGLVRVGNSANGEMSVGNTNGRSILRYPVASKTGLQNRKSQGTQYGGVVDCSNFDTAVKTAMTDGVGAEWTEAEQTAARARMGAVSLQEVLDALPKYNGEVVEV